LLGNSYLSGILVFPNPSDDSYVDRMQAAPQGELRKMHDLLIALAFIGMVIAPAIVAAKSGSESTDEGD
jgi:hypothetical protein